MKIRYLGTAALERIPAIFCNCPNCQRALAASGRNIMTHSQDLVNDRLLIDLNSETYSHFLSLGRTLWDISHVLITHAHCDHFTFEEFCCRIASASKGVASEKLRVYTSQGVIERFWASLEARQDKYTPRIPARVELVPIEYFVPFEAEGCTVTPLPANHADAERAFLYLIEQGGRTLFYGNDTGVIDPTVDQWLAENRKHIDLLSLDCTKGDNPFTYTSHMSMAEGRAIADRFAALGIIDGSTVCYFNHFSHNCGMIYDDLVVAAQKYGFRVTYDGLEAEV